METIMTSFLCL